jgi:hypothetical protein
MRSVLDFCFEIMGYLAVGAVVILVIATLRRSVKDAEAQFKFDKCARVRHVGPECAIYRRNICWTAEKLSIPCPCNDAGCVFD